MNKSRWTIQPPLLIRKLYPNVLWRKTTDEKVVYLTFDDGPIPEITPWVVDTIKSYGAKATFFCVADNVRKHPEIFKMLSNDFCEIGNHTYSHEPVSKVGIDNYLKDIAKSVRYIKSSLFRPPHGVIYPWHIRKIENYFSKIVCWDVLSMDYRNDLKALDVFNNVKKYVRPGSIIVFHDSVKAWDRLKEALPMTLEYLIKEGYKFELIKE